jgi:chorismate mutase
VRGATTVERDERQLIHLAVQELLSTMAECNGIQPGSVVSAIFTATTDLCAAFPAAAAREIGWTDVPMLCAAEIEVPGSQPRCLRVLLHVERPAGSPKLKPVYLREAASLRPDLSPAADL